MQRLVLYMVLCCFSLASWSFLSAAAQKSARVIPFEGAGSQGSLGFSLGIIYQERPEIQSGESVNGSGVNRLRGIQVFRGTGTPFSLGIEYSESEERDIQSAGLVVQWTLFEGFRLPALALRSSTLYHRDVSLPDHRSNTVGLAVSYDFLRVFGLFCEIFSYLEGNKLTKAKQSLGVSFSNWIEYRIRIAAQADISDGTEVAYGLKVSAGL